MTPRDSSGTPISFEELRERFLDGEGGPNDFISTLYTFIVYQHITLRELKEHFGMVDGYTRPVFFKKTNRYGSCGDEDDVYTVEEFCQRVKDGSFIDYDGFGYPVMASTTREGHLVWFANPDIQINPSQVKEPGHIPSNASHIVWFNR